MSTGAKHNSVKKTSHKSARKPMRKEYDFAQGERGKYARRSAQGTNVVVLEPDVAKVFSNSKSVNVSLRKIIRQQRGLATSDFCLPRRSTAKAGAAPSAA